MIYENTNSIYFNDSLFDNPKQMIDMLHSKKSELV